MLKGEMKEYSLLDLIRNKKNSLKPQTTVVTSVDGQRHIEKIRNGELGIIKLRETSFGFVVDTKPDLQIAEILPFLLLSSQDVVQNSDLLMQYGITHLLNIGAEIPNNVYVPNIIYKKIRLLDLPEADLLGVLEQCIEFIDQARGENEFNKILVHCNAGYSRSASVIIAYLMKSCKICLDKAIQMVKEKRNIRPNDGFMQQLEQFEAQFMVM